MKDKIGKTEPNEILDVKCIKIFMKIYLFGVFVALQG